MSTKLALPKTRPHARALKFPEGIPYNLETVPQGEQCYSLLPNAALCARLFSRPFFLPCFSYYKNKSNHTF